MKIPALLTQWIRRRPLVRWPCLLALGLLALAIACLPAVVAMRNIEKHWTKWSNPRTAPADTADTVAVDQEADALRQQIEALRQENAELRTQNLAAAPTPPRGQEASPPSSAMAPFLSSPSPEESGEPTEAEMREAIQRRIDQMNGNITGMSQIQPDPENPISALLALGGLVMGDARFRIGAFRKIGAAKAQGKPGYVCDYLLQLRMDGNAGAMMDSIMKLGGEHCTARFVKTGGTWVWIAPGDE
ncbi:MAG TPA: hypothetical protein PLA50_04090 [Bacteroidia bacterium]|nr:hypothetical protein [Bacteroidia bacterium]